MNYNFVLVEDLCDLHTGHEVSRLVKLGTLRHRYNVLLVTVAMPLHVVQPEAGRSTVTHGHTRSHTETRGLTRTRTRTPTHTCTRKRTQDISKFHTWRT